MCADRPSGRRCRSEPLGAPTFIDRTGYLPHLNLQTKFQRLNEGLERVRGKLGDELFLKLMAMSDRMRPLFEADPEDKTGQTREGEKIIREMSALVEARARELATPEEPSP